MKTICVVPIIGVLLALAAPAAANGIQVGYSGSTYGPYQSGSGGEFTLNDVNPDNWLDLTGYVAGKTSNFGNITSFQTFCIEKTEYIGGYSTIYNAALNTKAINGSVGPGGDPVSKGTGWLYSQFASGTLSGYAYFGPVSDRKASAALLQTAFWMLEDEQPFNASNAFIALLLSQPGFGSQAAAQADGGTNYGVSAVNLWQGNDPTQNGAQDQLYYQKLSTTTQTVPDGGMTLALLGMTLGGLAALPRRFRRV